MEILDLFFHDCGHQAAEKLCDCDGKLCIITYCMLLKVTISNWRTDNYTFCATGSMWTSESCAFVTTPPPSELVLHDEQAGHLWVLRRVAISMELIQRLLPSNQLDLETRTNRLESWASLDRILSQMVHLHSIDLFCGTQDADSEEDFNVVVSETRSLLPKVGTRVQGTYSKTVGDGRDLALDLFGNKWREW